MVRPGLILGAVAAAGVAFLAYRVTMAGGIANAASQLGSGVVNAAGGVASGAVGAVGASVGLPTPSQTTTDQGVARWLIDNAGHFEASKWAGAPAYLRALTMPAGSGTAPAPGSEIGRAFAAQPGADYDETARLLARYPAPREPASIFNGYEELPGYGGSWGPL